MTYFYLGLGAFVILLLLAYAFKRSAFCKGLFYNLAILALFGGLAALFFNWFLPESKDELLAGEHYFIEDAVRGYAAGPNVKRRVKKTFKEQVLYDVIYTTNASGLRVAPHDLAGQATGVEKNPQVAIFFGDSFTYGEGLNDAETLPYLFESLSGGRVQTYNFGFHGYGPNQMLRIIETGLLDKIVPGRPPMVVFYTALMEHIERAAGRLIWSAGVPRYTLSPGGGVEYAGTFQDDPDLEKNLEFTKSFGSPGSQLLAKLKLLETGRTEDDIELFVQMLVRSRDKLQRDYKAEFYVILWPFKDKDADKVVKLLKNNNINVININNILNLEAQKRKYFIEVDNHPTKYANEIIAQYLLNNIKFLQ